MVFLRPTHRQQQRVIRRSEAIRREENDDHLTTEERARFLNFYGIQFTPENLDEVFVNQIL